MNRLVRFALSGFLSAAIITLPGCQFFQNKTQKTPDFSNVSYIADLATLKCYSHNVASVETPGALLQHPGKLWFEYSGTIKIGVDATQVRLSNPDSNNVVKIYVPDARVLGVPDAENDSFKDTVSNSGFLVREATTEQKNTAFNQAQEKMLKQISEDSKLMKLAKSRAKDLLEEYVKNIGKELGEDYKVEWVDVAPNSSNADSTTQNSTTE